MIKKIIVVRRCYESLSPCYSPRKSVIVDRYFIIHTRLTSNFSTGKCTYFHEIYFGFFPSATMVTRIEISTQRFRFMYHVILYRDLNIFIEISRPISVKPQYHHPVATFSKIYRRAKKKTSNFTAQYAAIRHVITRLRSGGKLRTYYHNTVSTNGSNRSQRRR